jgi:uncharacterized membrane protein YphA (DoxX/SURF4 family)
MNYTASFLILIMFGITFLQSSYEKIFHWGESLSYLQTHFEKTYIKNQVKPALILLIILEVLAAVLCWVGCLHIALYQDRTIGYYAAIMSCATLLVMLVGQRIAHDYDGARTIIIYFIPAVIAVYWLN